MPSEKPQSSSTLVFSEKLSSLPAVEVLRTVEQSGRSVVVQFRGPLSNASVWFRSGALVDAELGPWSGELAFYRILDLNEGSFEVFLCSSRRPRRLTDSVATLLSRRISRTEQWANLLELVPPLDHVPTQRPPSRPVPMSPEQSRLYESMDGQITLMEVIHESRLDAVQALSELAALLRLGYFETHPNSKREAVGPETVRGIATRASRKLESNRPLPLKSSAATWIGPSTVLTGQAPATAPPLEQPPPYRKSWTLNGLGPGSLARIKELDALVAARASEGSHSPTHSTRADPAPNVTADNNPRESLPPPDDPRTVAADAPQTAARSEKSKAENAPAPISAAVESERPAIGRYEVLSHLAHGGMGTIYLCRLTGQAGFRRLFALKVLHRHLRGSDEHAAMLLEEARLAGRLYHPNVVGVVDAGSIEGQPYLVMDYIEGCTFAELLKRNPEKRPASLMVPIFVDALNGLEAAHSLTDDDGSPLNLVHCDVSPHNLLIGVDGICRVADFGVARVRQSRAAVRNLPRRGKPAYMSPEQLRAGPANAGSVDRRSDVFSMGVVLYNALTGTELFQGGNLEATIQNVLKQPVLPPSQVGLHPPACFDAICLKALERNPDRRYQTAGEMGSALRQAAMAENLLGDPNDLAAWIRSVFGRELELRRLSLLDAASAARIQGTKAEASTSSADAEEPAPAPASEDTSRTIMLSDPPRGEAPPWRALTVIGALALAVILVAVFWPEAVQSLFRHR